MIPRLQENYSMSGPENLAGAPIILPSDANIWEETAAEELSSYLEKATGKKLSIMTENANDQRKGLIYIGRTKYAMQLGVDFEAFNAEQWMIRTCNGNLILTGGKPRGVLYAVFNFLESEIGVRWWSPWEEHVPQVSGKLACNTIDKSGEPVFKMRSLNTYNLYHTKTGQEKLWAPRNRINTEMHTTIPLKYGGGINYGSPSFVHTEGPYYKLLQKKGLLKTEWVALRNGKREIKPDGLSHEVYQLCLSNPELREALTQAILANIENSRKSDNPPTIFEFSFNDTSTRCECQNCNNLVQKYGGSDAGLMLDYLNSLADKVKAKYPGIMISTLAYMNTEPVPSGIVPRDNVMITLCDTVSSYTSPLSSANRFTQLLQKWSKVTNTIKIWDYHTAFADYSLPMPFESTFQPDLLLMKKHNIHGIMTEFHNPIFEDMRDLRFWLLAKLYENPFQDVNRLILDFTNGFYGSAGIYIRQYLIALQQAALKNSGRFTTKSTLEKCSYLTPEFVVKALSLFDEAGKIARDSEILQRRIRHARLGIDKVSYILFPQISQEYANRQARLLFTRESLRERIEQTVAEQTDLRAKNLNWQGKPRADKAHKRFYRGFFVSEIQIENCDNIEKMTWAQKAWRPRSFVKEEIGKLSISEECKVEGKGSVHWVVSAEDVKNKLKEHPKLKFVRLIYLYGANFSRFKKIKFNVKSETVNHPPLFATMISPSGKYKQIPVLERNEITNGWKEIEWEFGSEAGQVCTHIYFSILTPPNEFRDTDSIDLYLDDIKVFQ